MLVLLKYYFVKQPFSSAEVIISKLHFAHVQ